MLCFLCGEAVVYDDDKQEFVCVECKTNHSPDLFKSTKNKGFNYHLKKIRIVVAILGALYLLYFMFRRRFI